MIVLLKILRVIALFCVSDGGPELTKADTSVPLFLAVNIYSIDIFSRKYTISYFLISK